MSLNGSTHRYDDDALCIYKAKRIITEDEEEKDEHSQFFENFFTRSTPHFIAEMINFEESMRKEEL